MLALNTNPPWLKKRLVLSAESFRTRDLISSLGLNTVCQSSGCPNLNECFSKRDATFLILGPSCTRACAFCSVEKGEPAAPDRSEPGRIREAVSRLGLSYVVITSVTRDDLDDGGASQFAKVVTEIRSLGRGVRVELLAPDFAGEVDPVMTALAARPDVFSHNIETAESLYPSVRQGADYRRSLGILRMAKSASRDQVTKSGIMVGMGEAAEEVLDTIREIRGTGCDMLTIGQYLRPSGSDLRVDRYVRPEEFDRYRKFALTEGFKSVSSGPFVRSSYQAEEMHKNIKGEDA